MIKSLKDVWSLDVRSLDIATSSKQVISWGSGEGNINSSSIRETRAQDKHYPSEIRETDMRIQGITSY